MLPLPANPDDPLAALERELAGLQPRSLSAARLALVASQLNNAAPDRARRFARWRRQAAVGCAAALAIAWLAMVWHRPPAQDLPPPADKLANRVPPANTSPANRSPANDASANVLPTLWQYRLAYADSPHRLAGLLDQHAAALLPATPSVSLER